MFRQAARAGWKGVGEVQRMQLRKSLRTPATRRFLSKAEGESSKTTTMGGREVRYKVSPQETFEKQQQEMFGNTFVFRMVEKIPVKNSHLRHIIAALIFMGILVSPKIISAKVKQGHGYLDMEAPDEIHQHREAQVRKQLDEK